MVGQSAKGYSTSQNKGTPAKQEGEPVIALRNTLQHLIKETLQNSRDGRSEGLESKEKTEMNMQVCAEYLVKRVTLKTFLLHNWRKSN
jgi:hypothetical protein